MKFRLWLVTGIGIFIILCLGLLIAGRNKGGLINPLELVGITVKVEGPPEISGWVAWWKEEQAYDLIASYSGQIGSVSPVWWLVDEEMKLKPVGKANRTQVVSQMKLLGVKIYPTLGSELTGEKLSPLFNDDRIADQLLSQLVEEIGGLEIDGLDIDLEGIVKDDRDKFVIFLEKVRQITRNTNLKLSVTIQAQDGKNFWFGAEGQDVKRIGEIADEVRVMAYDRHSAASDAGPISPLDWAGEVARYNLRLLPREKIVMGVPSYGYVWPEDGSPKGRQWDEMKEFLEDQEYETIRDRDSGELKIEGKGFVSWLSDAEAMKTKIEEYRRLGLNRFVIWHLGGIDEAVFDTGQSQ